jgi:ligand-binding sensor domain-containing protein
MTSTTSTNNIYKSQSAARIVSKFVGLLMISWLWMHQGLYAQEYLTTYKRFFIKASGPENYINTLANDSKGFLWLGTNNGLFRFDGKDNDAIQLSEDTKKLCKSTTWPFMEISFSSLPKKVFCNSIYQHTKP